MKHDIVIRMNLPNKFQCVTAPPVFVSVLIVVAHKIYWDL